MSQNNPYDQSLPADKIKCLELIATNANLFITGGAGTGKSFLIEQIRALYPETIITASTGIAAINIGGVTIHSWSGMGYNNFDPEHLLSKMKTGAMRGIRTRIKSATRLVIDEISMLSARSFAFLNHLFKIIRNNDFPFGGIQMILVGDFLQLPPVIKAGEVDGYCFMSQAWFEANLNIIELEQVFRQSDPYFIRLLKNLRFGSIVEEDYTKLSMKSYLEDISIKPVKIFTHNSQVDYLNNMELAKLSTISQTYHMSAQGNAQKVMMLKKTCLASEILTLKIGARVVMLKNTYRKNDIINGSTGEVIMFDKNNNPVVQFHNGKIIKIKPEYWEYQEYDSNNQIEVTAIIKQIPLALAWGITVHKSQGMSLDVIECDLGKVFVPGQVYVALSRARTYEGLFIKNLSPKSIWVDNQALTFYKKLSSE